MKIILLLCLISINSWAQTIITDRNDPRFIAYMDSVRAYKQQIAEIEFARTHMDTCSLELYKHWLDSLGKNITGPSFLLLKRRFKTDCGCFFSTVEEHNLYAFIPTYPKNWYTYQPLVEKSLVITKPRKIKTYTPPKVEVKDSLKPKKLIVEWYMNDKLDSTKLYTIKTP